MTDLTLVKKSEEFPHRDSPVALAFEAEIKRIAVEQGREIGNVVFNLAEKSRIGERQIYNYRTGKTDIPAMLIPEFCRQFGSNALAMAVVSLCNATEFEHGDGLDLTKFCSSTIRDVLKGGEEFLEVFDDGKVDGHELSRLSLTTAKIVRNSHRLLEVARAAHRRRSNPTLPTAA